MQETALWIPRGAFCPLEGGPRHIGTDTLAPVLQAHSNLVAYPYKSLLWFLWLGPAVPKMIYD